MSVVYFLITFCLILDPSYEKLNQDPNISSLRCIFMNTGSPCKVLGGKPIPSRILELYSGLRLEVKNALHEDNFSILTEGQFPSSPVFLLLMPTHKLSTFGGIKLALLISNWKHIPALAKHFMKSVTHASQPFEFLSKLNSSRLPDYILDIIAEEMVHWKYNFTGALQIAADMDSPLFAHLPLGFLSNILQKEPRKMLYWSHWIQNSNSGWNNQKPALRRLWAHAIIKVYPLSKWKASNFMKMGSLLTGCISSEMSDLDWSLVKDMQILSNLSFSTVQIRSIFNNYYGSRNLTKTDFYELKPFLLSLAPKQLAQFSYNDINLNDLEFSSQKYFPAVSQVLEYFLLKDEKGISSIVNKGNLIDILSQYGKFIYAIPPSKLLLYETFPPTLSELVEVQSNLISPFQALLLTGSGSRIDLTNPSMFKCKIFLSALPTSVLQNTSSVPSNIFFHLLEYMPLYNIPRTLKLLEIFVHKYDKPEVLQLIMNNPEGNSFIQYYPVPYLKKHSESFISAVSKLSQHHQDRMKKLPPHILSILLAKFKGKTWSWESLTNSKIPIDLFVNSMTCDDVDLLQSSDFIIIMSLYNRELMLKNKDFPKNLQHCCAEKLLSYLQLKASVSQQFQNDIPTSLLSEADIVAVGGFVLCHLPLNFIETSPNFGQIVQIIGKLSLSELLVSTSTIKLKNLIRHYLNGKDLDSSTLFELGNLTMFFPAEVIQKIDSSGFKLILEGNHVDKRICADKIELEAWRNLIIKTFGEPSSWDSEILVTLGDMLIAMSFDDLEAVEELVLTETADIFSTKYNDQIEWFEPSTFYKVCTSILKEYNIIHYMVALRRYIRWYIYAAQVQFNSIKPYYLLSQSSNKSETLNVISNEENGIKVSHSHFQLTENSTKKPIQEDFNIHNYSVVSTLHTNFYSSPFENYTTSTTDFTSMSIQPGFSKYSKIHAEKTTPLHLTINLNTDNSVLYTKPDDKYVNVFEEESMKVTESYDKANGTTLNLFTENLMNEIRLDGPVPIVGDDLLSTGTHSDKKIMGDLTILVTPDPVFVTNSFNSTMSKNEYSDHLKLEISEKFHTETPTPLISFKPKNFNTDDHTRPSVTNETMNYLFASTDTKFVSEKSLHDRIENSSQLHLATETPHQILKVSSQLSTNNSTSVILTRESVPGSYKMKPALIMKRDVINVSQVKIRLTCRALKMVGKIAELSLYLDDLKKMPDNELIDCIELFGQMDLSPDMYQEIWGRVPKKWTHIMGKLVRAASVSDLKDINVDIAHPWGLETVAVFGRFSDNEELMLHLSNTVISLLNDTFLSAGTLTAMGPMICILPNITKFIHPNTFIKAVAVLGSLLPCKHHCLSHLMNVATHSDAFGNLENWTSEDVKQLDIIIAGLSHHEWRQFTLQNKKALAGLQSRAAKCLPMEYWLDTPTESLYFVSALTAQSLFENENMTMLNHSQKMSLFSKLYFSNNEAELPLPSSAHYLNYYLHTKIAVIILIIRLIQ